MDNIMETVKDFILKEFFSKEDSDRLTTSTPLVTGGYIDSLATLKLVSFLEDEYNIELAAHEIKAENLNTIADIANFVRSKMEVKQN